MVSDGCHDTAQRSAGHRSLMRMTRLIDKSSVCRADR
jgi:hypothetical protein